MQVLRRFTDALEVWGWDEAFLQVPGDPEAGARAIQKAVSKDTGLSASVGIGDNKLRAKTASGFAKPAGIYRLTASEWFELMGGKATGELWGVGKKSARRLSGIGIATVRELADADPDALALEFGPRTGPWLIALARGEDSSPINSAPRRARSRSTELTFDENVDDPAIIEAEITRMSRELVEHARSAGRLVVGVTVKVRFAPFFTQSRSVRLQGSSSAAGPITDAATRALSRFELDRPVRLVGVKLDFE